MDTTKQANCLRCGRTLRSPKSIALGYGPTCNAHIRNAEHTADLRDYKPAQIADAVELIADGAIIPLRSVVFLTVSSDGREMYKTAPTGCNCPGGLKGRLCYHTAAARLLLAA
jgi:hypothetical protein